MKALRILAGPAALSHIRAQGLSSSDIGVMPGAAGGPKGLILGPLDRFLFGDWLPGSTQPIDLVGASIGAWRWASACLDQPVRALKKLEHDYIHQDYRVPEGQKRPGAEQVSREFGQNLQAFYGGRVHEVIQHPRLRLHVVTSRGQHVLAREGSAQTLLGYAGAYLSNALSRRWLGFWLHRVVFSTQAQRPLPFATYDFPTERVALTEANFMPAVQASCSIPFLLQAVHDIPMAAPGAHWDGGITDYHLHLDYRAQQRLVLYPHFQPQVVPGWLDKAWKRRHLATPFLERMVLLCPTPEWVASLPNAKLPDRTDFTAYRDVTERIRVWQTAAGAAQQLADEWALWLQNPDPAQVELLT
ncbi:MAG: hypothetical protein RIT26_2573 [Pseudomonadota bacterium]